ncbi:dCTP deaminase [Candidatus Microgenomates bacterium]|nr:dCTP deaminase [Candidatus Microgenomates bacterium]
MQERGSQGEFNLRSPEERLSDLERKYKELEEKLWCVDCKVPRGAVLSDADIKRLVIAKRILITPEPDLESKVILGTCKIDLRLGDSAKFIDPTKVPHIDLSRPVPGEYYHEMDIQEHSSLIIPAGMVIVATTLERIKLPNCMIGLLVGKSRPARSGLKVEGAPIFDAGWDGKPMLELHNGGGVPLEVHYGQAICAMVFLHLSSPTLEVYAQRNGVKYANQTKAQI